MSDIKRWDLASLGSGFIGMKESDDGAFVRNADHEAEIVRLRAELDNAAAAAVANMSLSCEKEREADALRVGAMRYRYLVETGAYAPGRHKYCPLGLAMGAHGKCEKDELDAAIDRHMGADA